MLDNLVDLGMKEVHLNGDAYRFMMRADDIDKNLFGNKVIDFTGDPIEEEEEKGR